MPEEPTQTTIRACVRLTLVQRATLTQIEQTLKHAGSPLAGTMCFSSWNGPGVLDSLLGYMLPGSIA